MTHHHFAGRLAGLLFLAAGAACAFDATLPLPAVTVTGPVANTTALRNPDHGYPYNATPLDLRSTPSPLPPIPARTKAEPPAANATAT